ncbi:hypothetical protein DFH08DRAFT_932743 [Mycena albidolilacea]|uniref:Uncharacterized protein n=1 Tax=Mycena albidolilacea TaxID=1033008 RepID=A0AAD7AEE9_9AGAR|nr:hypothetical protein DFH08DRAFT_932743 [Mycena albidolilacea]
MAIDGHLTAHVQWTRTSLTINTKLYYYERLGLFIKFFRRPLDPCYDGGNSALSSNTFLLLLMVLFAGRARVRSSCILLWSWGLCMWWRRASRPTVILLHLRRFHELLEVFLQNERRQRLILIKNRGHQSGRASAYISGRVAESNGTQECVWYSMCIGAENHSVRTKILELPAITVELGPTHGDHRMTLTAVHGVGRASVDAISLETIPCGNTKFAVVRQSPIPGPLEFQAFK